MPGGATEIQNPNQEQIQQAFQRLEQEINQFMTKISEMDQERKEHELVLAALDKVEPTRRCCRLVGGVMAERTVKEVRPAVAENKEKIEKMVASLSEKLKEKHETRKKFVEKFGLDKKDPTKQAPQEETSNATGVLV